MNRFFPIAALTIISLVQSLCAQGLLFPNSDFEAGTLEGWTIKGEAFRVQPTKGDNTAGRGRESANNQGTWWIGGYEKYNGTIGKPGAIAGDQLTGTLTSREFKITKPYISFRIGAGNLPDEVGVKLICEGKQIAVATGVDDEGMVDVSFDVTKYLGKNAHLQIFDTAKGGWGHINVDNFRASDKLVGYDAQKNIAMGMQSFSSYQEVGYQQAYRPQFHFTSLRNWLNDPNGMVYYDGEYHLFFQHNPKAVKWGNMTWGHAVSKDMVHWKQLPHAILPYNGGTIFSGTAVVDHNNSLGMQKGNTRTLVAAFTFAKKPFSQALAYSSDRGRTFTLWNEGKPVVANNGYDKGERDPKIFWHKDSQKWVMVLWVKKGKPGRVLFFNSDDLRNWKEVSQFDRDWVYECMDMVELPIDGNEQNKKWLLYDASFEYEIGEFDGKTFTTDKLAHRGEYGPNYYAAQSFNNSPDNRTVMIGWMRGSNAPFVSEKMPFNQQMSFPSTMELKTTKQGVRLFRWPVKEIESLYAQSINLENIDVQSARKSELSNFRAELIDFSIAFAATEKTQLTINLRGQKIKYQEGAFIYGQSRTPAAPVNGTVSLRALIDRASIELFANGGAAVSTHYAKLNSSNKTVTITSDQIVQIKRLKAHRLNSVWTK